MVTENNSGSPTENTSHSKLYSEIDKIFFSDGYNTAEQHLGEGITTDNLIHMSKTLYDAVDDMIEAFIGRCLKEGKSVACTNGCYLCCCQAVLVLPYEVLYLDSYIKKQLSKKDQLEIMDQVIEKDEITKKMKVQEFLHYKAPCPILKNGSCLAYKARPMACRMFLSSSKDGCIEEYHNPGNVDIFPDLYEFTIRAGRMINEGVCSYLVENQLFPTEWQIESSLRTVWEGQDSWQKWLEGENIFQKRNYSDAEISYLHNFGKQKSNTKDH